MISNLLAGNPLFGSYPKGIYVFGLSVPYYAMVIVCGMLIATVLSALLMKRRNMDPNFVFTLFVFCIPSAIVGARLFFCLTDPTLGLIGLFTFPWEGLSITGGVIGGVTAGLIVCLVCKVNFLRAADCVVINILFAQALGRWGNFFNAEVFGHTVTDPALQWFPFAVPIIHGSDVGGIVPFFHLSESTWHYAFFFYESVINMIGWAILFALAWKFAKKPNGIFVCSYFVWYGTVRSIMEPFREPEFILARGGIWWSEVFAVLMVVLGLAGIVTLLLVNYKKEGAVIGSKKGDPCGITKFLSSEKTAKPYFSKINMLGANYPPKPVKGEKSPDTEQDAEQGAEQGAPETPIAPEAPETPAQGEEARPDGQETSSEAPMSGSSHEEE